MTAQLSPTPVFKGWANDGTPLAYGLLYSYQAGTTTPQATYIDSTDSTPNTNPITLDARGECALWLDPTLSYKFNLTDKAGNQISRYPVDNISLPQILTQSVFNTFLQGSPPYVVTAGEIAANVTPVNYFYPPGNLLRYGTNTSPSVTDMSQALTNALASNSTVYIPASGGTYYCAQLSAFSLTNNQLIYGDGPNSLLQFAYGAGNNLQGNGVTKVTVRDLLLQVVAASGPNTYIGALAFINSTYCDAINVWVAGVWGCGIRIGASSNCLVSRCKFVNFQGTNADQADVYIGQLSGTSGSNDNIVELCQMNGGGWHGVIIATQISAGTGNNLRNYVGYNDIGQHVCYGIANYSGANTVDNFTRIIGNDIHDIQGTVLSGVSGAGIYCVGAGGDIIANNNIRNCCVQTTTLTLAPGAIGIAQGGVTGLTPTVIANNNISGMTKFYGIFLNQCISGTVISGNSILHPLSNTTGNAIGLLGSSNVSIIGGSINSLSTNAAINCNANLANLSNITISGVQIQNAGQGISFTNSSSFTQSQISITGNQLSGTAGAQSFVFNFLVGATITGNTSTTGNASAVSLTSCTQTRFANNSFISTGTFSLTTSGTCTGGLCDISNYLSAGLGIGLNCVNNTATGFNIRQTSTAAPSAAGSTQALGDVSYNTAGVTPSAWICTTAGTPGTFTGQTLP